MYRINIGPNLKEIVPLEQVEEAGPPPQSQILDTPLMSCKVGEVTERLENELCSTVYSAV